MDKMFNRKGVMVDLQLGRSYYSSISLQYWSWLRVCYCWTVSWHANAERIFQISKILHFKALIDFEFEEVDFWASNYQVINVNKDKADFGGIRDHKQKGFKIQINWSKEILQHWMIQKVLWNNFSELRRGWKRWKLCPSMLSESKTTDIAWKFIYWDRDSLRCMWTGWDKIYESMRCVMSDNE